MGSVRIDRLSAATVAVVSAVDCGDVGRGCCGGGFLWMIAWMDGGWVCGG